MNITLTPEGYTLDGTMRLVPVKPSREMGMAVHKSRHSNTMYSEIFAIMVKAAPNPPQPLSPWQPIATAQNDKPYIVGWVDDDGTERHDFDVMDDGVWRMHDDICEMAEACAPAGGIMPNRTAPYTHCIELPPLQEPAP